MSCPRNFSIVNIPSVYGTFDKAEEACNKIAVGSMTGLFKVFLSFNISLYTRRENIFICGGYSK